MIIDGWSYYFYVIILIVPVYLAFKLLQWMGWSLFVNN
ncbi:uncharacterized protein LOC129789982 [Lutzomyia longipalpis]|nr:uncharacterized protein LOC129789982 [Lutzomyia longipalpis]